ncbi:MAG: TonB-dependent receptor, partial [Holophagales bacterium]|nr:TonB-dependent receptor [Holophagales bacterium]
MLTRKTTLTLSVLLLTTGSAPSLADPGADSGDCALRATVVDGDGKAVAGAAVHLLAASLQLTSDSAGRVCAPELAAGAQPLLVVAEGFSVLDATVEKPEERVLELTLELTPAFGEEMVVTGTRTAKRLADSPVHVQLITRDTIDASAARTLADAIELTPGVRIEQNCQNCNFSQVRMLGLEGPYSQILVDGQPTVSSLALVYGIEQFPARLIENVEAVEGGGAAIYGAGAVGGVINLIPHAPFDTHTTLEVRAVETGGEAGHSATALADWSPRGRRTGVSILGQVDSVDPVDIDGDGFTEVTSRELTTFAGRAEHYLLGDRARIHAEANWTEASRRGGDLERFALP